MYIPPLFNEADPDTLFALIEKHNFGLLISQHDGEPFATHLPMLADRTIGPKGSLIGHFARANPQWQQSDGKPVLAIFSGPHAYVSPTWHESENVVPTWNYVAVHVYGVLRAVHETQPLLNLLQRMVDFYESSMPKPWVMDSDDDFLRKFSSAVVGFEIEISRIEGKLKLNQNHPRDRREKVIQALSQSTDPNSLEIAALMTKSLKK